MTATYDPVTATYDLRGPAPTVSPALDKFPANAYALASSYCTAYFDEMSRSASSIDMEEVERAASVLLEAYTTGSTVFSCGNGGSAAISNHLQCDHLKGVRTATDLMPSVISLASNVALLTAIANDIGYEDVFVYQLESQARPGDVLITISSSGRSPNIVRALTWARRNEVRTISLTGFSGGEARTTAEIPIHVAGDNYGIIEDLHQCVMHAMAQYIRQSRMSEDAIALTKF
jgi:D-sedoheptulose 7-phosphate isomerase/D-glycero-D-manno-heptose 1,7-bisphosphate phosphatase